jgi:hypothetical protein
MNMNNLRPPISIGLFLLVLVLFGCERLSNGVVREIDFPEHTPEIVVTLMARNQMDSLVSRAHSSAGILDSIGSKRIKSALYTLTHEDGTSLTWGGQEDWTSELGHVLTDVELAAGTWSLLVEAEGFESVTAEQRMPPVIDTLGGYALAYDTTLVDFSVEEYDSGKFFLTRTLDLDVNLPNRSGESDFFVLRILDEEALAGDEFEEEEEMNGGYAILTTQMEDDPRLEYNRLLQGYIFEDAGNLNAASDLPFRIFQERWGEGLKDVMQSSIILEVAAVSPEMALYYQRLDLISNPSGGPLFTEPILAYSNVSSGYGCFGLYTSIALPFVFE